MTATLSLIVGFLVLGAHAVVPWSLPQAEETQRKLWALVATPLLLAAVISGVARLRADPDPAIEQGMAQAFGGSSLATLTVLAIAVLFACDIAVNLGGDRLQERSWTAAGALGVLVLILTSLAGERLRIGIGPGELGPAFLAAAAIRALVSAAAGEALATRPPKLGFVAGISLPCYPFFLPLSLREATFAAGLGWTCLAAGGLFLVNRFLPRHWHRVMIVMATLLAAIALARIAEISAQLGKLPELSLPTDFVP